MINKTFAIFFGLLLALAWINRPGLCTENGQPRLFLLKSSHLAITSQLLQSGDKKKHLALNRLLSQAKLALRRGPYSVTLKETLPPGGDKHDFLAYGGYCWPNPNTSDGLPWIYRDGYINPDAEMDWKQIRSMANDVEILALAFYFKKDERYANHAALLLRTFFINKETRMNPNANYGKIIPGVQTGGFPVAGFGYIFRQIYDAAGILESSAAWSDHDKKALQQWTREFIHWLDTSPYALIEKKRNMNHGTFYDLIRSLLALYVDDREQAAQTIKYYMEKRMPLQFKEDGTQPFEMKRANNFDYCRCNLSAAFDIAQLADNLGNIDMWNYATPAGGNLQKSTTFILPYITGEKEWPYFNKATFQMPPAIKETFLRRAALGFNNLLFTVKAGSFANKNVPPLIELTYPQAALPMPSQILFFHSTINIIKSQPNNPDKNR